MNELKGFKNEIDLVDYAMTHDYTELDRNQSSRTCVVLRRQSDDGKIAVSRGHDGHWVYYDFRCNKGGSILDFVMQQTGSNLGGARQELRKGLPHKINLFSHTARFCLSLRQLAQIAEEQHGIMLLPIRSPYITTIWKVAALLLSRLCEIDFPGWSDLIDMGMPVFRTLISGV